MDIQAYIQSGVIESYVLGIATNEEISEVEQLLSKHPEVQKAIDEFSLSLEQYAMENAVPPPVDVKNMIKKELEEEFRPSRSASLNVVVNNTREQQKLTPPPKYKVWRFMAAASIILFLISSAFNVYLFSRYSQKSEDLQALLGARDSLMAQKRFFEASSKDWASVGELIGNPDFLLVKMPGVEGKKNIQAAVFVNRHTQEVYVFARNMPPPHPNKQYQLWAMVNGKPVDAGMISHECAVACKVPKFIPGAEAFAITLEKEGGSPTPDMTQLVVMGGI